MSINSFINNNHQEVSLQENLIENSFGDVENLFHQDVEDGTDDELDNYPEHLFDNEDDENNINFEHRESDDDDDNDNDTADRIALYEGAKITKEESDLLVISYIIWHNITDYDLKDLLKLIGCHLP